MTSFDACVYRFDANGEEIEIDVEITGDVEPYFPGSWEEPPSGGGASDLHAIFYDDQAKTNRLFPLTDDEVQQFEEQLVEEEMERDQDRYEAAMEDKYDQMREDGF